MATVVTYGRAGASGLGLFFIGLIFFGCSFIWDNPYDYSLFWTLQVISYAFFFFALVSACAFASLRRRAMVTYVVTDPHHHHHHDAVYVQPAYGQPVYAQPVYAQPAYAQPSHHQPPSTPAYNPSYPPPPDTYYKA